MLKNTSETYGLVSKILHWLMALIIFTLLAVGFYMTGLAEDDPSRNQLYSLHKSFGVLVMMLAVIRIVWIIISPPPPEPSALQRFEIIIAKSVQGFLYFLILALPFSGYATSTFAGYGVNFFKLFNLPVLFDKNPQIAEYASSTHEILAFVIIALVLLHVIGAIKHRLKGNPDADVLKRML
jgi:cytochrome b561